jgi:hypothetical protein
LFFFFIKRMTQDEAEIDILTCSLESKIGL